MSEEVVRQWKRYPKYKDSRVEWLGEVPAHWDVDRLKWSVKSCENGIWGSEPDGNLDLVVLRVADFDRNSFTVDDNDLTIRAIEEKDRESRLLNKGDLLLEKSGGGEKQLVGCVVQYNHDFPAVTSNFVAKMSPSKLVYSRYLTYFHAHLYSRNVNYCSIKQTTGIQNLDSQHYLDQKTAYPPREEQNTIAQFLDRKTAKIDTLIAKKERLIELLQEKRTALISHAVTKGLNPDVPMKDSGVEWLGKIPEHWTAKKLKYSSNVQSGITLGKTYTGNNLATYPYLRVANVQYGYFILDDVAELLLPQEIAKNYFIQSSDILVTEGGDIDKLGRGTVWEGQIKNCLHQNHIFAIRTIKKYASEYFVSLLMSSHYGRNYFTNTGIKSTNLASTNKTKLGNFSVLLPSIEEQKKIISYLDHQTTKINNLITKTRTSIDHLKEYRTALISAAVTGKIDVREKAA